LADERPATPAAVIEGTELLRLARSDRSAARAALAAMSDEAQARACQDLRLEVRGEFLMLVEHPEDIVPLLPEAELVQTVRAGGMSEAAWLLELATPEQRIAAFDLDCWTGAELQVARVHEWLDALIEAGRPTLVKALQEIELEILLLAVHAESEVAVVSKEQEPPIGFFTPDGVVYFGTAPDASPHRIHEISHALFAEDPALYWRLVYGLLFESPSECEEYALRWRTNRLQDLGFPDIEQAMRVYRPLAVERVSDWVPPVAEHALVGSIQLPRQLRGTLLGEALANLPVARAADLLGYVLGVANSLAVADGLPLSESESVPRALEKAVRGIDTGLRELARVRGQAPEEVLDRTAPLDLFRVGATVDPSLKERAS
jgi:Family of unknown function (DUF6178)